MPTNSKFNYTFVVCDLRRMQNMDDNTKSKANKSADRKKKLIKWFWILLATPFVCLITVILLVAIFAEIPSFEELEHPDNKLATLLIAEEGEVLTTFHVENRTYVSYDDLAPCLVEAAISTEDARFRKHSGIDFRSLGRVVVKNLILGNSSQGGGSTITQQLAKTLYPRRELNSKVPGWNKVMMVGIKLKEWITAVKIERNYTKDEIMAMYLNSIFFGSSAYGIDAASRTFFAKSPSMLTVEEAATLVGMVNKPTRYNPVLHPDYALGRRNFVLGRMHKSGFITRAELDSLTKIPINVEHYQVQDHNAGLAPYFRDMLRRDLYASKPKRGSYSSDEDYSADSLRWADDPVYGWINKNTKADGSKYDIDRDGLRIYTTINYKMQKYAEEAVEEHLGKRLQKDFDRELKYKRNAPFSNDVSKEVIDKTMNQARRWSDRWRRGKKNGLSDRQILAQFDKPVEMTLFAWNKKHRIDTVMTPNDSIRYCKGILRTGFVAIEPGTGHVKAYVGGPNYRFFKYDNVRQGKRQVGSTIKPFLYTLAMQEGYHPCDRVVNMPQTFEMYDGSTWTPRSTDKEEWIGQTVTLKWGLSKSSNNISAFLMKQLGPQALVRMMRQMGITSHLDEVYSLCVGSAEVEIFNMVASVNTYPSAGVFAYPQYITRIEDSEGNVIANFSVRKREAISSQLADLMVDMMQGVVDAGTGARLRSVYGFTGDIAGKTGTTNDNSDGWFIGYTPDITAGVWVGGEDRNVHFQSLAMGGGSNMALPIWAIWYKKCLADPSLRLDPNARFPEPPAGAFAYDCSTYDRFLGGDGSESTDSNQASHDEEEDYYFN